MKTTHSKDGTTLAYEELGQGPPLVLVDGAFCMRAFGPMSSLSKLLARTFTVFHYDRRGRGDSTDTAPYAVEREVEDLAAIVEAAGGTPYMYGISSGAALALRGVASGIKVKKLCVYEPPFALDGTHTPSPADWADQIATMLEGGDRDGAVKLFMKVVGVPAFVIFFMRLVPSVWPKLRTVAHTLPYDFAVLGDTQSGGPLPEELREKIASIGVPTLAMAGGKSPDWMHHASKKMADTVADGSFRVLPGQDHNLAAKALAPVLLEFFGGPQVKAHGTAVSDSQSSKRMNEMANSAVRGEGTGKRWAGRVLSGLAVAFLLFDVTIKLTAQPMVAEASAKLGLPDAITKPVALLLLACIVVYLVPRSAVVGAVLLTGYLGGAVLVHVRVGDPLFSHTFFPLYVAAFLWGGLFLRDRRVRQMLASPDAPRGADGR